MSNYSTDSTDLKSLIGIEIPSGYISQQSEQELLEVSCEHRETLTCYFCSQPIEPDQSINLHHPIYKSDGGTHVEPAHETCHIEYHSRQGDFRNWGKLSAQTRRWAFNLKNVRNHPAYEFDRAYYSMLYAQ
jgi:hypothetical protein